MARFRLFGARAKIQKGKKIGAKLEIDLDKKKNPSKKPQKNTCNKVVAGEVDHHHDGAPPKHFTDFCALCKKDIKGQDAFMYRDLQAFCSPGCRDDQIALDNKNVNPSSTKSTNGNGNGPPAQIEAKAKLVTPTPRAILKPAAAAARPNKSKPSRVVCCAAFFP